MNKVVMPWIREVTGYRPWVWQKDSTTCNVSVRSLQWLQENTYDMVGKEMWPPNGLFCLGLS
ncbi:Putative LOC100197594 [Caligus rogercresseyi]|uniref:LOC100197594 n=1 Tax=Caligus rogercresseyi TaxID=217165 RepID=A0A7T8KEX1_CALRO|nr:Putative LOC100197594 [Caligus rogercresseyi]